MVQLFFIPAFGNIYGGLLNMCQCIKGKNEKKNVTKKVKRNQLIIISL